MKDDVRNHVAGSLEQRIQSSPAERTSGETRKTPAPPAAAQQSLAQKYGEGSAKSENLNLQPLTQAPAELPDFSKYGAIERIPMRSIRRKIAQNMAISWSHIPHVTTFDEADVTQLDAFLSKNQTEMKAMGHRLTLTVFALKAICAGLKKYPQFNASLDERTGEIIFKHYYNLGVAVATERGLIVPVIRNIDQKSLIEIAKELADIADKTRAGKIELDRLQGGTFTLTNIGAIGGSNSSPMINYPECAILAMARAAQKPVVRDGKIEIGLILPLSLSFDHRIADGAEAAFFLQDIVQRLQNPLTFLLDG
jgi:pyruvate dehydrogenase E2 component (dihydrolipoamide acetyltransferase)